MQSKGRARQNNIQLSQEGFWEGAGSACVTQQPGNVPNPVVVLNLHPTNPTVGHLSQWQRRRLLCCKMLRIGHWGLFSPELVVEMGVQPMENPVNFKIALKET